MFGKVTRRVGKVTALGLVVATIGVGFIGGSGHAYAMDNGESAGASCMYGGVEYSDGAVIRQADGALYKCKDGSWVFECGGCVTGPASASTGVLTTNGGTSVPQRPVVVRQAGGLQKLQLAP